MSGVLINTRERLIAGVQVIPLKQFSDERGEVYHMLKETDSHFICFGEIYFSLVNVGVVKAWKFHERITTNYACISGCVKFVLYDDRSSSPTKGALMEVVLGPTTTHCSLSHRGFGMAFKASVTIQQLWRIAPRNRTTVRRYSDLIRRIGLFLTTGPHDVLLSVRTDVSKQNHE